MSEGAIVDISIIGMVLAAICFIFYIGMSSDLKQKEIIKEVVQEIIKHEQEKESTND